MGHQVRFFLADADIHGIEIAIREAGDFVTIMDESEGPSPLVAARGHLVAQSSGFRGRYFLRKGDFAKVQMQANRRGTHFVDEIMSPVIQFTLPPVHDAEIAQGRFYYVSNYPSESGLKVTKDEEFVRWARRVFRGVTKALQREQDYYVGPVAFDLRHAGKARLVVRFPGAVQEFTPTSVIRRPKE